MEGAFWPGCKLCEGAWFYVYISKDLLLPSKPESVVYSRWRIRFSGAFVILTGGLTTFLFLSCTPSPLLFLRGFSRGVLNHILSKQVAKRIVLALLARGSLNHYRLLYLSPHQRFKIQYGTVYRLFMNPLLKLWLDLGHSCCNWCKIERQYFGSSLVKE